MLESVAWAGLPEKVTVEKTSEESEQWTLLIEDVDYSIKKEWGPQEALRLVHCRNNQDARAAAMETTSGFLHGS